MTDRAKSDDTNRVASPKVARAPDEKPIYTAKDFAADLMRLRREADREPKTPDQRARDTFPDFDDFFPPPAR